MLSPRNPLDQRHSHQPDFGSVSQIAAMLARHWPSFFEAELGALFARVHKSDMCAQRRHAAIGKDLSSDTVHI